MDSKIIDKIFGTFNLHNQDPETELKFINNYTFLLAIILSARTTDAQVNKATESLFKVIKTPKDMLKLGEEGLIDYIKTIGLYRSKAKNIMKMSEILIQEYNSEIPANFEKLKSFPGIGSKTAKVFLNAAFDKPVIAVDTHVFRVSRRLGLTKKDSIQKVEEDLEKVIPKKWQQKAHHWLVLHGRYICKARKPLCEKCLLSKYCEYFKSNIY
ncbi:MAG: endonuclease III [Rickettsiales bacterium]|nr:endonuclease III [Rickettsiales bacterium]